MPFTRGFRTPFLLQRHHRLHWAEVGAISIPHYHVLADDFLGRPLAAPIEGCIRPFDRATIRWDPTTDQFGILAEDGFIQTYYILDLRWHSFPSNRAYFQYECNRRQR